MNLSSDDQPSSTVSSRVLEVSQEFSTGKEFLEKCGITNLTILSDLRSGRIKSPGVELLAKIVEGTGCSADWLLTGRGPKYPAGEGEAITSEAQAAVSAFLLLDAIERLPSPESIDPPGQDVAVRLIEAALRILKACPPSESGTGGRPAHDHG